MIFSFSPPLGWPNDCYELDPIAAATTARPTNGGAAQFVLLQQSGTARRLHLSIVFKSIKKYSLIFFFLRELAPLIGVHSNSL